MTPDQEAQFYATILAGLLAGVVQTEANYVESAIRIGDALRKKLTDRRPAVTIKHLLD